jgi:hypothetical protein
MENKFIQQIIEGIWKPITFTIFNFIENEWFVHDLYLLDKEKYTVDDFEYLKLELTDKEKLCVKMHTKVFLQQIEEVREFFEKEPRMRVYVIHETGSIIVVKLKDVKLTEEE